MLSELQKQNSGNTCSHEDLKQTCQPSQSTLFLLRGLAFLQIVEKGECKLMAILLMRGVKEVQVFIEALKIPE